MSEWATGMDYLPLSVPNIGGNEGRYALECLSTGWVSGAGEYVARFESAVRELTGTRHAVACSSGTAALHVALLALGVGPGDAVIVPTVTFIASANAVRYCGAEPVLVGCDRHLGLDPDLLEAYLQRIWSSSGDQLIDDETGLKVKAIMPVHVFGDPCALERLLEIAERFGLPIVEDATESLGSYYTEGALAGRFTGTIGRVGTLSFNANKIITTGGGGMLVTDDDVIAQQARYLFHQAKDDAKRYIHGAVGFNYALGNVAAAIGVGQMERLARYIETKRRNRARYAEGLAGIPGLTFMNPPEGTHPNGWFYSLIVEPAEFGMDREEMMTRLDSDGIQTRPLWLPIHMQRPYAGCRVVGPERAVWYWERILNLPCSSNLSTDDVDRVIGSIRLLAGS